jgi:DnaJ-class molecular chaperone
VGLREDCPEFVLRAVQKAYRVNLHPDLKPAAQKPEAEKRFKEAESAFAEIERLRRH